MARRRKPQDPTFALIEQMVEKSGLNATTQEDVMEYSKYVHESLPGALA